MAKVVYIAVAVVALSAGVYLGLRGSVQKDTASMPGVSPSAMSENVVIDRFQPVIEVAGERSTGVISAGDAEGGQTINLEEEAGSARNVSVGRDVDVDEDNDRLVSGSPESVGEDKDVDAEDSLGSGLYQSSGEDRDVDAEDSLGSGVYESTGPDIDIEDTLNSGADVPDAPMSVGADIDIK